MSRNARFGESGEFNQNSPNVRKYSNEVANGPHLTNMVNLAKIRQNFGENSKDEYGENSSKS